MVYELEVRGVLLVADRPEAFAAALASALRARPAARGVGPYRELGEVTSSPCEVPVYELETVEPPGRARARERRNTRVGVCAALGDELVARSR